MSPVAPSSSPVAPSSAHRATELCHGWWVVDVDDPMDLGAWAIWRSVAISGAVADVAALAWDS